MGIRANDPRLFAAGLAVAAVFAGIIGWGRVKPVNVPRYARWETVPVVCAQGGVDEAALREAVRWWESRGHRLHLSCVQPTVFVLTDPTLDSRDSVEDLGTTHGQTVVATDLGIALSAEVRVLPGSDAIVYGHELGHVLGFSHPRAAPTGHILHPSRPGWDGRGVGP